MKVESVLAVTRRFITVVLGALPVLLIPAIALADASDDINTAKTAIAGSIKTAGLAIGGIDISVAAVTIAVLALQRKAALGAGEDVSRHNHHVMSVLKYAALVGAASTVAAIGGHFMQG